MVDARDYHQRTNHDPAAMTTRPEAMDPRHKPRPNKQYRDLPIVDFEGIRPPQIPTLAALVESHPPQAAQIDRKKLATLCYLANGIVRTGSGPSGSQITYRAAACTGKLYHIELYLVIGELPGIEPGVYHFSPPHFGLTRLRSGDYRGIVGNAIGQREHPSAYFIATSTWWRNAWKYTDRAYRHAFWDAGTIIANLQTVASAMTIPATPLVSFADMSICDLLGLDSTWEAPISIVSVGERQTVGSAPVIEPLDTAVHPISSDHYDYPLIYDAWAQSTFDNGTSADRWRASARRWVMPDPLMTNAHNLDTVGPEVASQRPLWRTIQRRRSCRTFAHSGPTKRQVGTVLDRALSTLNGGWTNHEKSGPHLIQPYFHILGVDGVPDGSYRMNATTGECEHLEAITRDQMAHMALDQQWVGNAHVNLYLLTPIEQLVKHLGNRGYRAAQLEAGIALGRLYLATFAHRNLGGSGSTFFDTVVEAYFSTDEHRLVPLCLFAFGRTPDSPTN